MEEKPVTKKRKVVQKKEGVLPDEGPPDPETPKTSKDRILDVMPKLLEEASCAQKHVVVTGFKLRPPLG
jgi:hypothetical protein